MTQAHIGHGSIFELHNGSQFATIGEVVSISLPSLARDALDVTGIGSPDGYREFIPGLKDGGEVTVEMNFVAGSQSDILVRQLFNDDDLVQFRITVPAPASSPTEQLTGFAVVTGYSVTDPVAEKMAATLTMKVSGRVQYSSGV
jgi:predicted secreted protein